MQGQTRNFTGFNQEDRPQPSQPGHPQKAETSSQTAFTDQIFFKPVPTGHTLRRGEAAQSSPSHPQTPRPPQPASRKPSACPKPTKQAAKQGPPQQGKADVGPHQVEDGKGRVIVPFKYCRYWGYIRDMLG